MTPPAPSLGGGQEHLESIQPPSIVHSASSTAFQPPISRPSSSLFPSIFALHVYVHICTCANMGIVSQTHGPLLQLICYLCVCGLGATAQVQSSGMPLGGGFSLLPWALETKLRPAESTLPPAEPSTLSLKQSLSLALRVHPDV